MELRYLAYAFFKMLILYINENLIVSFVHLPYMYFTPYWATFHSSCTIADQINNARSHGVSAASSQAPGVDQTASNGRQCTYEYYFYMKKSIEINQTIR